MIYRASKISGVGLTPFRSLVESGLVKQWNHEAVRILLRGGEITNQAAGAASGCTVSNDGVTAENGDFVLAGYQSMTVSGHGFKFGGSNCTIEMCFLSTSTNNQHMTASSGNYNPQIVAAGGIIYPYNHSNSAVQIPLALPMTEFKLFTMQVNRTADTITTWLNGVRSGTASGVGCGIGWPSDAAPVRVGQNNGDYGLCGKLRYFRLVEGLEYDESKDFVPNMTGY